MGGGGGGEGGIHEWMSGWGRKSQEKKKPVISKAEVPVLLILPPLLKQLHKQVISAGFQRELHYIPFEQATKYFYLKNCLSSLINNFTPHQFQTREDG